LRRRCFIPINRNACSRVAAKFSGEPVRIQVVAIGCRKGKRSCDDHALSRHAYGSHPDQFADLALPAHGDQPFAVAVLLHGGLWRAEYGLGQMAGLAEDLVSRGWAAYNVEYRRVGSGGGVPATLDDVAAAIDALDELEAPLDLDRVVAIGHSAGGQLALWAAAARKRRAHRVRLAGAVGQAPLSDLERAAALNGSTAVADFCGGSPSQAPGAYRMASPAVHLPFGVPQLLVHGLRDELVPASLSEDYADVARTAGDDVTLVLRERDGHFEHLDPRSAAWEDVVRWLRRFV
jgi:acetyl esterase/lipase